MRKYIKTGLTFLTLAIYVFGILPSVALAATTKTTTTKSTNIANNGQALEIAPPVIYLTANPGQSIKTTLYLRDISSGELIVTGQANDFVASGEDGTPKLLLDNSETDPYSLKSWVQPPSNLHLVPREIKTMSIVLNVPKDASPGGHYGVIRFTATAPGLQGTGVSLSASLGALILLTVNGNIHESLSVTEFSVNKNGKTGSVFESAPLNFVERLNNTGNNHLQPTGQVIIKDMFGRQIAGLNVNVPPKSVLPQSTRKFEQPLDKTVIGNRHLFGRYTAQLKLVYGSSTKQTVTANLAFWVIPYKLIAGIIVGLIALFFIFRFAIRRYNRFILNQGQKNRSKK